MSLATIRNNSLLKGKLLGMVILIMYTIIQIRKKKHYHGLVNLQNLNKL